MTIGVGDRTGFERIIVWPDVFDEKGIALGVATRFVLLDVNVT